MTPEQLLLPRYEVIVDYPYNPWLVGEILRVNENGELIGNITGYPDYAYKITEKEVASYPAIFRLLQWSDKREEHEMPGYINYKEVVYKVASSNTTSFKGVNNTGSKICDLPWSHVTPATLTDYEAQIKMPLP